MFYFTAFYTTVHNLNVNVKLLFTEIEKNL